MRLKFNWDLAPAYDVIARLEGSEYPDEWVIRGNHRDAWVFGAGDPLSGNVAMLEEARGIGELAKSGWRPKRTIVYASWDAEEPGLLGSTEWVEQHADELSRKAVAYINTDGTGRGFLGMGGSHALQPFMNQIGRDVEDPETGVSVYDRALARGKTSGSLEPDHTGDLPLSPLGSGSDYTPFLQHVGISSLNLGFGGESGGGSYHSIFDSYDYYKRFGDPGFEYGITLAKVTGRVTMRLADADVLPFRFQSLTSHISDYVDEVQKLADDMRKETADRNAVIEADAYRLAADPTETYIPPEPKPEVPYLNFAPLENGLEDLKEAASAADKALMNSTDGNARLNDALAMVERAMISEDGLPRRPWFTHLVYAPGFYTGYGVKTLPGVREAIEERKWDEAENEVKRAAEMFGRVTDALNRVAVLVE